MDREHLDRLGVGFEPARALLLAVVAIRVGDALGQPAAQRGDAEPLGARGAVQQLREVAQVGQPALAVAGREHARGQVLADRDRLEQRGDAAIAQDPAPAVKAPVHLLPLLVRAVAIRSARHPRKGVKAAVLARTGEAGRSIASSRASQSRAAAWRTRCRRR